MVAWKRLGSMVAVSALCAAACGSDDTGTDFGVPPPATIADATTSNAAPPEPTPSTPPTPATSPSEIPASEVPASGSATREPVGPLPTPALAFAEVGVFDQPVEVAHRRGDPRIYVAEQPGRVIAADDLSRQEVLDITERTDARGEQGLLGLAFHPTDDRAYVNFTDLGGDTVVAEYAFDPATGDFDEGSYREVLTAEQPFTNHNGGELVFGPDGMLYIGLGDGGSSGDPQRVSLDLGSRLGKILRIDPTESGDDPFRVPADNPFVDDPSADPAIWAYGLRNPWRFAFDPTVGDLWIADVGQGDFEEINRAAATAGGDAGRANNFGWSAFEGYERFNDDVPADGASPPVFVYDHDDGRCSISGGTIARNSGVPGLDGWYLFGDYCSGQLWALDPTAEQPRVIEIGQLGAVVAVADGPEGALYVVSNAGPVLRITGS